MGLVCCCTSCVVAGELILTSVGWAGGVDRPAVKRSEWKYLLLGRVTLRAFAFQRRR